MVVVNKEVIIKPYILLLCLTFSAFSYSAEKVNAIVNASVNTPALTKLELRRIFSKRVSKWQNGQPIIVFVLPSKHPIHQRFTKEVLKIFPYQLDRIWNKLTFSGIGTAPIVVENYQELLEQVKRTPGAIGYGVDVAAGGDLHVIEIKE